jgi:hypothetical protein
MEYINSFILFNQFDIQELRPIKQDRENFLDGVSDSEEYLPEINSPYYVYYDEKLAYQFTPTGQANSSVE